MTRTGLTAGCRPHGFRRSRAPLLPGLVWFAAGCAGLVRTPSPPPLAGPADSVEYEAYRGIGTLDIRGQAFLATRTGEVKLAARRLVTLDPATSYAKRWFSRYGADAGRFDVPARDPRFLAARKTTVTDASGRFAFSRLPAGTYLLRSTVIRESESADSGDQGGLVAALVSLGREDIDDLSLSRQFSPDSAALLVVPILPESALPTGGHSVLAHLTVTACNSGSPEEADDERAARARLVVDAARRGADAVGSTVCRKRGLSLTANCVSRIVCEGDAILFQ